MTRAFNSIPPACAAALEFVQRQLDGDAPDLPPAIEAHLEECVNCRERFQAIPDLLAAVSQLDPPQLPPGLTEHLVVEIWQDRRSQRRQVRWQVAGALAAAVLLAIWLTPPQGNPVAPAPATFAVVHNTPNPESSDLRKSMAEMGEAVVAISQRAARETVGDDLPELPEIGGIGQPWQAEPAAAPLADARQGLAEGFDPVVSSARRAVRLFLRENKN